MATFIDLFAEFQALVKFLWAFLMNRSQKGQLL